MTLLPRLLIVTALSGAAAATMAEPVAAQRPSSAPRAVERPEGERGWIGVSVDIETSPGENGTPSTSVTVTEVSEGSPAARAGIRAGDVILSINGARSFPVNIRAGDTMHMTLERAGRTRSVDVTAVPRPLETGIAPVWTLTVRADSMIERMYQAMDSLRVRLVRNQDGVTVLDVDGRPRGDIPATLVRGVPGGVFSFSEFQPPFGFSIFGGEAHDSLRREMDDLNGQLRDLRSRRAARLRQLTDAARAERSRIDSTDSELRQIDRAMADAGRRATELREAMDRAVWQEAAPGSVIVRRLSPEAAVDASGGWVGFRPLDPYLLGQNRAAGAEVVDLRPELAEYFGVDGGVLVVDVAARTPAALAGIQPGDVLTDVGRTPVHSIEGLRAGLSVPDAEIPVIVIRKGQRLQLLLKR